MEIDNVVLSLHNAHILHGVMLLLLGGEAQILAVLFAETSLGFLVLALDLELLLLFILLLLLFLFIDSYKLNTTTFFFLLEVLIALFIIIDVDILIGGF